MYSPSIQKLIDRFSKFPTIGPRVATRFCFYLMRLSKEETDKFIKSISELKEKVKLCKFCFNPYETDGELCEICSNPARDKTLLCLVEKESDLASIENIKRYKGLYFILGGTLSNLKKQKFEKLRIKELEKRIRNPEKFGISGADFKEIIIATNPTVEGEATFLYIKKVLKSLQMPEGKELPKITRLGRGLPIGGELEYADEETLDAALKGRK